MTTSNSKLDRPFIDIAVGILKKDQQVCLSLRQKHQSHADCWEFPGGKIEAGESAIEALQREFIEELALETSGWQKLIVIPWHYEKVSVRLHVYQSQHFIGEPKGNEGQVVKWFDLDDLSNLTFPAANQGIIRALQVANRLLFAKTLPSLLEAENFIKELIEKVASLESGKRPNGLVLRLKSMAKKDFLQLLKQAQILRKKYGFQLFLYDKNLLNQQEILSEYLMGDTLVDGLVFGFKSTLTQHFAELIADRKALLPTNPSTVNTELKKKQKQPWILASVHNAEQALAATDSGADALLCSPVKATKSHADLTPIEWTGFAELTEQLAIPVFALGGLAFGDLDEAQQAGGQGVASSKL